MAMTPNNKLATNKYHGFIVLDFNNWDCLLISSYDYSLFKKYELALRLI